MMVVVVVMAIATMVVVSIVTNLSPHDWPQVAFPKRELRILLETLFVAKW